MHSSSPFRLLRALSILIVTAGCHGIQPNTPSLVTPPVVTAPQQTTTPPTSTGPAYALALNVTTSTPVVGSDTMFTYTITPRSNAPTAASATVDFGDATTRTIDVGTLTAQVAHVYARAAKFTATFRLVDRTGASYTAESVAIVSDQPPPPPPSQPPGPSYGVTLSASPASVVMGDSSTLTASVTAFNGAPTPTSFAWDCNGDGTVEATTTTNTTTCVYPSAGTTTSRVTVTGGSAGGTGSTTVTVASAAALTVSISAASYSPAIGTNDDFTATVTSSGPVPASFRWEWDTNGDGTYDRTIASATNPETETIVFGTKGPQTVKVRVTDVPTGRTAIGTVQVTVP